jgi:hypothetical protein
MVNLILWGLLVFGMFNIVMSFASMTKNFWSAVIYKVIPFVGGVSCIIIALNQLEFINLQTIFIK